jgi:hypothetical protein
MSAINAALILAGCECVLAQPHYPQESTFACREQGRVVLLRGSKSCWSSAPQLEAATHIKIGPVIETEYVI